MVSQLAKGLPCRPDDLKLFSSPHVKSQAWTRALLIPLLRRWTQDGSHWLGMWTAWVSLVGQPRQFSKPKPLRETPPEVDLRPPQSRVGVSTHGCLSPNTKNTIQLVRFYFKCYGFQAKYMKNEYTEWSCLCHVKCSNSTFKNTKNQLHFK